MAEQPVVSGLAASADSTPRRVNVSLRPQDSSMIKGLEIGEKVVLNVDGTVKSLSAGEYGCNVDIEVDVFALKKPEPEKFVEQVEKFKILKG